MIFGYSQVSPESTSQTLVDDLRGILEEQALRNSVTASSPNGVPGRLVNSFVLIFCRKALVI